MTPAYPRAANMLGALSLAVADSIQMATERAGSGLAQSEPAALVTLAHYPGQSVGALARTLGLTHSGAVRLASRLESAGLLRRCPSAPGRTLALTLTPAGTRAAVRVLGQRRREVEQLVGVLEPDQAAALERIAGRLLAALTSDRASARRLCRLCDESRCAGNPSCPVGQAPGA